LNGGEGSTFPLVVRGPVFSGLLLLAFFLSFGGFGRVWAFDKEEVCSINLPKTRPMYCMYLQALHQEGRLPFSTPHSLTPQQVRGPVFSLFSSSLLGLLSITPSDRALELKNGGLCFRILPFLFLSASGRRHSVSSLCCFLSSSVFLPCPQRPPKDQK